MITNLCRKKYANKNNEATPSYEDLPQQITIAYPISTIFPDEPTNKRKSSSKKGVTQPCDSVSPPASGKASNRKGIYVRGKCVDFSPAIINQHLGRCDDPAPELEVSMNDVCKTITGDKVKMWPRAAKLSTKYALLNKIVAANWVPTTHSNSVATGLAKLIYAIGTSTVFDYDTYIFNATILHGSSTAIKMPIAFPTLICDIILSQHPGICTESDVPVTRPSAFTMDFRLLEGTHVADIVVASLKKSATVMTKRQMIANLKEVSKMLCEKKELVDGVIQALELEQTQADEVGVGPSHGVPLDDDLAGGETEEEKMASDESPSI
ncbi:unnamed protein product [Trifolium pratense]|uniref:Uncharacterized protein n=1 Tax=Trifolium pratense TaxID=57577 RepID=A0ACB0KSR6_TRIPR|nr:unnamed protein product [Trifolium pratense]